MLQESPGRPASGSPRPAGRAGQPNVTSSSPMAAVKKPDPNMKGNVVTQNHVLLQWLLSYWGINRPEFSIDLNDFCSVLSVDLYIVKHSAPQLHRIKTLSYFENVNLGFKNNIIIT